MQLLSGLFFVLYQISNIQFAELAVFIRCLPEGVFAKEIDMLPAQRRYVG